MRHLLPLAVSLVLSGPALAADQYGTITATADGTAGTWFVNGAEGQSQSGWMKLMAGLYDVSLWGNPTSDDTAAMKGALLLDFSLMAKTGAASDATLTYMDKGPARVWLAEDATLDLTLATSEISDAGLHVTGTFSASPVLTDMSGTPDPSGGTMRIEGSFDVTLPATE